MSLVDQLLFETDQVELPSKRSLLVGPYSEYYRRSFLLYGTDLGDGDKKIWIAGLSEVAGLDGKDPVKLPESTNMTKLQESSSKRLACKVTTAHKRSLGELSDPFEFDEKNIPHLITAPDKARGRFGLAHDPISAPTTLPRALPFLPHSSLDLQVMASLF